MNEDKKFIGFEPCPDCGSQDNVGRWQDANGAIQKYCFTCQEVKGARKGKPKEKIQWPPQPSHYDTIPWRHLLKDTCVKYQVTRHGPIVYFPSVWDGEVKGIKSRDFTFNKSDRLCHMACVGEYSKHFFGWQAVHTNKILGIALGEFDGMAVYQATGVPCLSPPAGDGSLIQAVKSDFARLDQFEKIVFLPDRDHESRAKQPSQYVAEAIALLGEERCFVAPLAYDDPNEYVMQGHTSLLKQAFYSAESKALELFVESPSSLIAASEIGILTGTPLDKSLQGLRGNEVTYVLGAPGSGKTTFVQNLTFNLMQCGVRVGALVLEGSHKKFVSGLANVIANGNYHAACPDLQDITKEMIDSQLFVSKLTRRDSTVKGIVRACRAAVKVADCKVIVIDNLSGAADPEKLFESASALVLALDDVALDLDAHILVIAHVGRAGYSEPPTLGSAFGSGHVEKFGYNIIGLYRKDKLTRAEVLKNREFGPTPHDVFFGELEHGRFRFFNKKHQPTDIVDMLDNIGGEY